VARPAIPYIPDDSPGEYKFDDKNPGHWEYHIRVKHEKEEMEYEDSKAN
jgi:hypothetical protein